MLKKLFLSCIILIIFCEIGSSTPVFLQAISSALATIPYTGFPMSMTAGLAGAKLAVGAKLLYYLGFFGQRSKTPPKPPTKGNLGFMGASPQSHLGPQGFLPLPYSFSAGPREDLFGHGYDQNLYTSQFSGANHSPLNINLLVQALAAQGINPLQLFQALDSLGVMPEQLLQTIGIRTQIPSKSPLPQMNPEDPARKWNPHNYKPITTHSKPLDLPKPRPANVGEPPEKATEEDVESFFSFLRDMDDNKCISRLVCDIGTDPNFLGEFSQNINSIINSLDVLPTSGAIEYIDILKRGREHGNCASNFPECSDGAYEIVKGVAPSVGVPGMNSDVN